MSSGLLDGPHSMVTNVFKNVRTVAVPVTDQDRSAAVLGQLGFSVSMDAELQPGFRWIEMSLPDGEVSVALVTTGPDLPTGIDTGIRLVADDARAAHDAGAGARLPAGALRAWPGGPPMFSFTDPDGNRFYVSETSPS